nr:MAG TPA: hypothetical protein [Caudoviricetes sp.]
MYNGYLFFARGAYNRYNELEKGISCSKKPKTS